MNHLTELHETARYFVRVTSINEQAIEVTFPSNLMIDPIVESYVIRYELTSDGIVKYIVFSDGVEDYVDIQCPDYAKRIIILADIMIQCSNLNIDHSLILKYKDGDKIEQDETIIDTLKKPDDRYLEIVLFNLFNTMAVKRDCSQLAQSSGVLEGYLVLLKILATGGF